MAESFQLVATTEGRERRTVLGIADQIGEDFGVDLSALLDALTDTGVCVAETSTLAEARTLGTRIIAAGADYLILDSHGEEVDRGSAAAPRVEVTKPSFRSKTRMGGFGTPELLGMAATQKAGGFAPKKLELEEPGGFAHATSTIGDNAIDPGKSPTSHLELEESGGFAAANSTIAEGAVDLGHEKHPEDLIELDERSGFAAPNAPATQGSLSLDGVDPGENELVLEDGGFAAANSTIAEGAVGLGAAARQPAGEIELDGPGGFASATSTIAEGAMDISDGDEKLELDGPGGFAAPAPMKSGFSLDHLDADALVMLDGSGGTADANRDLGGPNKGLRQPEAPRIGSQPSPKNNPIDDASFLPPDAGDLQTDDEIELETPAPAPETPATDDTDTSGELEWVPASRGDSKSDATATPPSENATDGPGHTSASSPRSGARPAAPRGPLFLGGKLRRWPRARVAMGFLIALGLSSILPMCHARSVRTESIQPLLVDLSTVRDHGALLVATPGYEPAPQIEATINSLHNRHAFYTMLIWSILGALLLFLWFRFT